MQHFVGALLLFGRERGCVDEQVGALRRLEDDASGTRIAGDDHLATWAGRPSTCWGCTRPSAPVTASAGLEAAEEGPPARLKSAPFPDVEATRPFGFEERVLVGVHAVLDQRPGFGGRRVERVARP